MTYLPKTNGSEDDNPEQAEELEVRFLKKYLVKLKRKYLVSYFTVLWRKNTCNEINVCNKNYLPGHLFISPKHKAEGSPQAWAIPHTHVPWEWVVFLQ